MSRMAVEDSIRVVSGWLRKSVSVATWAAYSKVWQEWQELVQVARADPEGPDVRLLVIYFLSRNMENGVSRYALGKKLVGLSFLFKWQVAPGFRKDFWVWQVLKGYQRSSQPRDHRHPISFEILEGVLAHFKGLCSSAYEVSLFKVAFSLAFFGAFRIGELVSPSK